MPIKHNDFPKPSKNEPFKYCKLNRQQYADILTNIVQNYAEGFVLAINNEWGTGKTTFVKMWRQQLEDQEFKTLYFNAWENDYADDVLVALLSELEELKIKDSEAKYKTVLEKAAPFVKKIIPGVTKAAAKMVGLDELLQAAIDGTISVGVDEMEKAITSYIKRKEGVKEFRESLEKFVESVASKRPVVFIIDELDRCRPNYAVSVLEQMKHLFSVPGIVFVLSIDKVELGNAVRGAYGSEKIKADEYLRRFIDLEYSLPEPTVSDYCKYLFEYFKFGEFMLSGDRTQFTELQNDKNEFLDFSEILFGIKNPTLRQIEKIFAHTRLVLNTFNANHYIFSSSLLFLTYLYQLDYPTFLLIKERKLNLQEFLDTIESVFINDVNEKNKRFILSTVASLLRFYFMYIQEHNYALQLITKSDTDKEAKLTVKSKIDTSENNSILLRIQESFQFQRSSSISISHLINRISLTEPFVSVNVSKTEE
jgi:hypothetical protein